MSKVFNHPSGRRKNFLRIRIRKYHIFSGKPYPQHGGQLCSPIEITESGTETHDCPYHSRYCKPQCRGTQNRPCKVRDTLGTELVCFVYIGYRCAHPIRMNNIYIYIYIRIWKIKTSSTSIPAYATYMKTLLRVTTREWIYPLLQGKYGR